MRISVIAAMAGNRAIGSGNRMPWHLPEDMKRFRAITSGHPVIMGRKTYESIGKLLPQRINIIITRQREFKVPGAVIVHSLEEAFERCPPTDEIFVIGGAEIYTQALPRADRLYLTLIHQDVEGDAFFPKWKDEEFRELEREEHREPMPFSFVTLERIKESNRR